VSIIGDLKYSILSFIPVAISTEITPVSATYNGGGINLFSTSNLGI
jgi:hypothetical protein